jgi:hypothetical protein
MIIGYYYLHTNGELIFKYGTDCVADIRESNFARMCWPIDPTDRANAWSLLVEAFSLGANPECIKKLAEKWGCTDFDADHYAELIGCVLKLDGNSWCAHRTDFTNLQESPAGFGDTKLEAMAELCKELGYKACKLWGISFEELLK